MKFSHLKLMNTLLLTLFLTACLSPTVKESSQSTDFVTYSAEAFFKTTSVFGSSINHDGSAVLVSNNETGIFNAYKVPINGDKKNQLTFSQEDSTYAISWFPQDDRILFQANQGGNELDHLYVRDLDGKVTDLTPGEGHKANFLAWHNDDLYFYVISNERDAKYFDLYQYHTSDYKRTLIFENNSGYNIDRISPNGRWLALTKTNSNADSDLFLVDLQSAQQQAQLITPHEGDVQHSAYTFTTDSRQLIYATNAHGEFNQAWVHDIDSQNQALYYAADWDVSAVYFSKDGQYQVVAINQDAQTKLSISHTQSGEQINLPELPGGDLRGVNFSNDSKTMVFYLNADTSPSNLYVHQLGTDSIKKLTQTGNPEIAETELVTGEIKRFESFDGLQIPGILFKPRQAAVEKVPALIFIHGGPGGQSRKGYSPLIQHLVNNGYAIFMINNRGSSGYGKTFFHLDDKKHGDHDLKDVVYNKYYLQSLDWVDADKIGVIGGSYGGYLTMAAMAFTDEFKVGINIFGVTNWVRTLKSIPPYWESFRKSLYDELGDPEVDGERLHNISPVFFGHQVKSPVLVVQGANDPRVLKIESDEMVAAIRDAGTHVEYLLFDDEGHGFSKKKNQIAASEAYLNFLNNYLR